MLALSSCIFVGIARADLIDAQRDYKNRHFDAAFNEFHELAQLGQPVAQYNVAIIYSRGEGTRKSAVDAYAWATNAKANGHPKAQSLIEKIRPYIGPADTANAELLSEQFSTATMVRGC